VSQLVSAAPERVFDAFTVSVEVRKWNAPGPDFTVPIAEVDARVGGSYRIADHTTGWTGTLESLKRHLG
jgi:uncharacterized protein YndB with AHSA1/START domain